MGGADFEVIVVLDSKVLWRQYLSAAFLSEIYKLRHIIEAIVFWNPDWEADCNL
jgi:hypothetical protein